MKRRIILAFMAMCVAVSGFALENGEFVYTPQGRFLIIGANVENNNFADLSGWTAITATEGKTLEDLFIVADNAASSIDATIGEGMYYKFEPTDASATYVVSYKIKGPVATSIRKNLTAVTGDGKSTTTNLANVVRVAGNTDRVYGSTEGELIANTGEELTEDWQTFSYAIQGDGTSRTWFISFTGMATTISIADLQIAPAIQVADLRQRDAMVEKMEAYKNCYEWSKNLLDDFGFDENLEALKAMGDTNSQDELVEVINTCQEIIDDFVPRNMDDFLTGNKANYLGNNLGKISNGKLGDWTNFGRAYCSSGDYPDLGHYQASNTWNNGSPDNPMGVSRQFDLPAGSCVFSIESRAAVREPGCKQTWNLDEGMRPAYGVAYIVKINEDADPDTIVSVVKDLQPINYTPFVVVAKLEADGQYEIGLKTYCKDTHKALKVGSVTYVKDARIYGKNDNKYNQAQLSYEADVLEQISTGSNALAKAAEYLGSSEYFWGKNDLKASVEAVTPEVEKYEAYTQDQIIETFDANAYVKDNRTKTAEEGLLVYEVYVNAVRDILAANKKFEAVNDTLNSMQSVIDNAEAALAMRVYDAAIGKEALKVAIEKTRDIQTAMKATDYSEENVAAIKAANAELDEVIETFKTTIPESSIAEIISLDFEQGAALNDETGKYETTGVNTSMEYSYFSETTPGTSSDLPFEIGLDKNGEKVCNGVLRVGNGSGTATIPAMDYGTNILKVSMDWWFVRLTGKYVGFDLVDENNERVVGLYFSPYDGTFASGYDDFALDACDGNIGNNSISKFFIGNTTGDDGSCADNNKTHMEAILDYGEKSMYLVSITPNGTFTSDKVEFNCKVPTQFVVKSNYTNYNGRRCWFDNLKIQSITAGATEPITGVETIKATDKVNDGAIYNLAGQKVDKDYKGLLIKNGKKMIQK